MPNATERGPSALRNLPIDPDAGSGMVAQSIGVPPGDAPQSPSPPPPVPAAGASPHPAATVPVRIAPAITVHREPAMIDYYQAILDPDGNPLYSQRVVRSIDSQGRLLERIVEDPVIKVTSELAYIADGDDKLATLVDGSVADIPMGEGLPGHYGRPKSLGGGDRSRTMHRW